MAYKKIDKPRLLEGETVEARWDPKKIIIGVVILAALGLLGAIMLTGIGRQGSVSGRETLGTTNEAPSLPSSENIERIIRETRETMSNITADNLTSSQAAIQKMISDLEILQGKKDVKDVICELICKK
ncbi:MAG: hypothetical protein A3C30_05100 [Candidatus Levybacteria bacterium RIFCSPHIGHO2_02_FULL_40_18]|nr:MAG: hypothetical protein A2869_02760 [Candidatus Levybacteria bacterium RIFCSPHIGHO2_01_FULL_40_58]OGH26452.1 MAG: hypothetical protein A3C30_05100 [Candidatus Levybacteria bacterium RIFCSPHIGHO2_02_FULL_40_18]OGH31900.1 MAG: hypothetical protein A3E43_00900 [Candidatus Levybacteria bacterium RIFCSPHIGHO2_12_FULL_40_31]OGH40169.1 MAG: hypothetical protein A2894_04995 [Candidatus Levybacteria bacterium RIFCSPLOWO2_01_FULL_40_64]OGH49293.1 MAG: hypothetical protein A3I54_01445 [Candidatus Lev